MSTTYNVEPNPTAKVLLHTTTGDLELELFAKQTPTTSRNFLQLCLDGYYDNTVFHRLVRGFILQGGDPTGTGQGGESSYDGEAFADEFHSRLKYTRRGLLGMVNSGKRDDNGSQFFFTLAATPELQEKNTMFGRIAGDTIYNLMKMAEAEIREGSVDQPMYPTKITSTEIIINPFADMVPRVRVAERTEPEARKAKKPKRKAGKNVLSFGDDADALESAPVAKKAKYNNSLVSADDAPKAPAAAPERATPIRRPAPKSRSRTPLPILAKVPSSKPTPLEKPQPPPPRELSPESEKRSKLDRVNAQIAELKASMKRNTGVQNAEPTKKKSLLESMVPTSTTRGRKRGTGVTGTAQEQATLDMLSKFKSKLETTAPAAVPRAKSPSLPAETAAGSTEANGAKTSDDQEAAACDLHFIVGCQSCTAWDRQEEDESDDDAGWMAHSLSFAKDRLGKDLEWKRKNEDYLVIDPLEEAKRHKANAKGKREWDDPKGRKK
ncbi:cyclophilin-like domain-containing protein [Ampelomyces quisqualis]|uniref:Cyclophilin-like domain-containing protein n=1 Tax=Ampelomyces quisqualis TaxID=50730 RepID=A0A6A5QL62_AMPQU|nr:cyclophilin-like domain-containing protein [Ampelomyces quisqualis]